MADIIHRLDDILSSHLNRPVNENFVKTILKLHSINKTNLDGFAKSCNALGLSDEGTIQQIYQLIGSENEEFDKLEIKIAKHEQENTSSKKHKIDLNLSADDLENDITGTIKIKIKPKWKKEKKIKLEFDDDLDASNSVDVLSSKPIKFKKIKKEDAMRIKHEGSPPIPSLAVKLEDQDILESVIKNGYTDSTFKKEISDPAVKVEFKKPLSLSQFAKREKSNEIDNGLSLTARKKLDEIRSRKSQSQNEPVIKPEIRSDSSGIEEIRNDINNNNDPEDLENDREWYNTDEYGHLNDDYNPFGGDESYDLEKEKKLKMNHLNRITSRKKSRQQDNEIWERQQLKISGFQDDRVEEFDLDIDDENDNQRVNLSTHHLVPPFLDGQTIFTRQKDLINPIRDPLSDLATFAKNGSFLVQDRRQKKERQKKAKDAATVAGTAYGNVIGVKDETEYVKEGSDKFADNMEKDEDGNDEYETTENDLKTLKEQRRYLPAFAVRNDLLKVIGDNQVTIVIGETGSGKTTQLTQFLYEEGYGSQGMIGCTQPRRVAAMSVAKRVSDEMEVKLGDEVGFAIRFEDCTSRKTVIKYMTEGILLRETLVDPDLDKYSCIIMDEAHERALNTDVLLGLFKTVLARRKSLKLIVTSATMNADRFSTFFGGAPQFTIPGRTFPVDVLFSKSPVEDYVESAVKQVLTIHLQSGTGDILVFMTGQEDVETTCEVLAEKLAQLDDAPKLEILPMYSQLPADLQTKIFNRSKKGIRKVVVATNIAETSLTVDGIKYVVDPGFSKMKVYNPKLGMEALQVVPISLASANQRSGRAGRTASGTAFRLYTERSSREEMYLQQIPEIQRTNLSNTLLLLKSLGVNDLIKFPFMDPPPQDTMSSSLYDLWSLGALDNFGNLTPLGFKMSSFPMEPSLSKLLLMSAEYGCSEEIITIVSMLSVNNIFFRPKERQDLADAARERFYVADSDHLTLLNVYSQWISNKQSQLWCNKFFLHSKQLKRAKNIREQLITIMKQQKLAVHSSGSDWDIIRKCICAGYYHQAAKVKGFGEYINLRTSMKMELHPTSALFGLGDLPMYIVYHELILTSKEYMSVVTAVDPLWLLEFGSVFYGARNTKYFIDNNIKLVTKDMMIRKMEDDKIKYEEILVKAKEKKKKSSVVRPVVKGFKSRRGF